MNKKNNNNSAQQKLTTMLLLSKLNYRGDWYLLRAKFTNDWNFVREVGRGSGMEERSLEIGEV